VNPVEDRGIGFFGKFLNGRKSGKIFIGLIGEAIYGQGFLYGQVDKDGHLTGKDIAYIYPGILLLYIRGRQRFLTRGPHGNNIRLYGPE
jgi:hypothetical protein